MAAAMKDSPFLKIVAAVLGSLVLLAMMGRCQQQAQIENYYNDQLQQNQQMQQQMYQDMQGQNQLQQQQMQQMLNGGGYYGPRSSEPAQDEQ